MGKRYILISIFFLQVLVLFAQKPKPVLPKDPPVVTRILFLLDCSGSMLNKWNNEYRMDAAKRILGDIVDSLKLAKNVEIALRVYGHQFDGTLKNCTDSKLEVPFAKGNHDALKIKLNQLKPRGTTPIAYSLEQSANDFPPATAFDRNVIIIITDGLESCNGDPCAISLALQKKKIFLKPFIIGMGNLDDYGKAMDCIGKFVAAKDAATFKQVLKSAVNQSLQKTTVKVNLLDASNKPLETNVNMTFLNAASKESMYDYIHYIGEKGPDFIEIDGLATYDLVISTTPVVIQKNISIELGKANEINVKCPQGGLSVQINGANEYIGLKYLVKQANTDNIIAVQKIKNEEKYLIGKYDLEVLTLPRSIFKGVEINSASLTKLSISAPGILNIPKNKEGFGSIYSIAGNGVQEWIYNFENNTSRTSLPMQPGNYKLVFRSKDALGSKYTYTKNFFIKSGQATVINLFDQ